MLPLLLLARPLLIQLLLIRLLLARLLLARLLLAWLLLVRLLLVRLLLALLLLTRLLLTRLLLAVHSATTRSPSTTVCSSLHAPSLALLCRLPFPLSQSFCHVELALVCVHNAHDAPVDSFPLLARGHFFLSHQLPQLHYMRPPSLCIRWHTASCGG
jgi:hypothetical protein